MELKKPLIKENNRMRNQQGFTLIEIIAVLVILSIMAVVAVPKYFDLQSEAKKKAMKAGMAEVVARINQHFASELLNGNTKPNEIQYNTTTLGDDIGDEFTYSISDENNELTITVTAVPESSLSGADPETKTIPKPGPL